MQHMKRWRRLLMVAMTIVVVIMCMLSRQITTNDYYYTVDPEELEYVTGQDDLEPVPQNWRGLTETEIKSLSALGRRMYLGDMSAKPRLDKNFTILVWQHGPLLETRHIMRFGLERHDPFEECSVSNCRLTYESSELQEADAVVFHLHRTPGRNFLPSHHAHAAQRWVFLTDENPYHTFTMSGKPVHLREFNGLFNWSMTYRMDSDVPVPSGRTLPLTEAEMTIQKKMRRRVRQREKTKLAAIMISNCGGKNKRWEYVKQLQEHMKIDVYGYCGNLTCEGHFTKDCPRLNDYKFYLAFENGDCKEYVTEKAWWNAYHKGAVPVIMGVSPHDCARLLPPKSYINVRDFSSPASLARYLQYLNDSPSELANLFRWKNKFKIVNEHGYFQTPVHHYCRLCEALNYNDPAPKVYHKLQDFWNKNRDCYEPVI